MTSYPFTGMIPITGHVVKPVTGFAETSWDTMTVSLPAQSASAAAKTAWDSQTDDAEPQVYIAHALEFDWS